MKFSLHYSYYQSFIKHPYGLIHPTDGEVVNQYWNRSRCYSIIQSEMNMIKNITYISTSQHFHIYTLRFSSTS
jgi:hypothetical protein